MAGAKNLRNMNPLTAVYWTMLCLSVTDYRVKLYNIVSVRYYIRHNIRTHAYHTRHTDFASLIWVCLYQPSNKGVNDFAIFVGT